MTTETDARLAALERAASLLRSAAAEQRQLIDTLIAAKLTQTQQDAILRRRLDDVMNRLVGVEMALLDYGQFLETQAQTGDGDANTDV